MPKVSLSELSVQELRELSKNIEKEIAQREIENKKNVLAQMRELAAGIGMTVEEVIESMPQKKTKGQAKYQNPNDPEQTWTGRGKRPGWLNDLINRGKRLEELEIR